MPPPRPFTLIAELSYQCPLHCPYCSNPMDIGHRGTAMSSRPTTGYAPSARRAGSASSSSP